MRATERVQGKHLRALRSLTEAVERCCRFGMRKRSSEVRFRERSIGRVETRSEYAPLVAATKVLRPERIRLVFEHFSADE